MTNELPLSKPERGHLDKITNLINEILQSLDSKEYKTARVDEIRVYTDKGDGLGLSYTVVVKDPKEILIDVLQIDMLRKEVKEKLGITLRSIRPVDHHTIELNYRTPTEGV